MSRLSEQISRRRTFAIISHPDAGKTTLTEKLLLFGGAIQLAGAVKAKGDARRAHSDWMKVERERGISVASSVMTYDFNGRTFNLLDTPGHEDFGEDTYRTLTAVDSAVMVIDAASWPIGMGRNFKGCYDILKERIVLMPKGHAAESADKAVGHTQEIDGLGDPALDAALSQETGDKLREDIEMARGLCPEFDLDSYREGHLSPVFFGSAINNFGVRELLEGVTAMAPPPQPQATETRDVDPGENKVSGFVFRIQANMDPKHRDRIAFFRLSSGHFKRGMKLHHVRSGKPVNLHNPVMFLAQDRETAEEAWAGDIIGIPNHGNLRIGDTLTQGEVMHFAGIPSFAPELLQTVRPEDPMRAKHLGRALEQMAEEGAARVFKPRLGSDWIVGVVGSLQFDVLADRIRTEYEVPVRFEPTSLYTARWIEADDHLVLKKFSGANSGSLADDHDKAPVFLARNAWHLEKTAEDWPDIRFLKIKEQAA